MRRTGFTSEHDDFRRMIRDFLAREAAPHFDDWLDAGLVPREFFRALGKVGVIGMAIPEEYGGGGLTDFTYNVILSEEAARALISLGSLRVHLDVVIPYFLKYANEEQRRRWPARAAASCSPRSR